MPRKILDDSESRQLTRDMREAISAGRPEDLIGMTYRLKLQTVYPEHCVCKTDEERQLCQEACLYDLTEMDE